MVAVLVSLCAAAVYGGADFYGGLASKKTAATTVVILSQLAGVVVLALAWLVLPGRFYASDVGWGVAAGVAGGAAIACLYAALAVGRMGVVSPITAVIGASVPVVVGFAFGERPAPLALAGIALAFVAVALVSANAETRRISFAEPGLALAVGSGTAIGFLYVFLARGHADGGLALLAATRVTSLAMLVAYGAARRESLRPAPGSLPTILLAGALDMGANVLYIVASRHGLLAVVAVLTSLYPASTVALARIVLKERLETMQWFGVACAACGVALIAARP
ncbi:MAG: DMT family transporter [Candidatus Eremiobacteraeota bacterium]|nr:DMT family transporter [Candidatus Eremiobacteraeota bacterium]